MRVILARFQNLWLRPRFTRHSSSRSNEAQLSRANLIGWTKKVSNNWRTTPTYIRRSVWVLIGFHLSFQLLKSELNPDQVWAEEYEAIDRAARKIKLLTLEPGQPSDDIVCSIHYSPLDGSSKYEALSYVWGDADFTSPIICNDDERQVTSNLAAALRHLRDLDEPRIIWIDALCIDQENPNERSEQVRMMGDIYSRADRVLIWLGPEGPETGPALLALQQLENYFYGQYDRYPSISDDSSSMGSLRVSARDSAADNPLNVDWQSLAKFLTRPWFQRLWVVQEAAKAKAAVLICGRHAFKWESFCDVLRDINRYSLDAYFLPEEGKQPLQNVITVGRVRADQTLEQRSLTLYQLYTRACGFSCTDPRDRVFALLGLANDVKAEDWELNPDYTIRVEEVYKRCAIWNILRRKSLESFSCGKFVFRCCLGVIHTFHRILIPRFT